jgi:hypothetical protein
VSNGQVIALSGGQHNHPPHTDKIRKYEGRMKKDQANKSKQEPSEMDYIVKLGTSSKMLGFNNYV